MIYSAITSKTIIYSHSMRDYLEKNLKFIDLFFSNEHLATCCLYCHPIFSLKVAVEGS